MRLRNELSIADIDSIVRLHGDIYREEYGWNDEFEQYVEQPLRAWFGRQDERERVWIAEDEAGPFGCIGIVRASDTVAQIRWFLVDPRARGAGVGTALLDRAIVFSRERRYESVRLWTVKGLEAAARLYKMAGFQLSEEKRSHLFGVDLIEQRYDLAIRRNGIG